MQHRFCEDILELSQIAWPGVLEEYLHRLVFDASDLGVQLTVDARYETFY